MTTSRLSPPSNCLRRPALTDHADAGPRRAGLARHGQAHSRGQPDEAYTVADELAFEHVEVLTEQPREALEALSSYGALFLGEGTLSPTVTMR